VVNTGAGRRGSRWRRAQAQCMANGAATNTPCYLCHQPINYHFTRYYPLHSMAGTAHHIIGLAQGGDPLDPTNLAPAHRGCNTRHSNRLRGLRHRQRLTNITSRRW
jgi:5-methylcytosine-specific restriction endonuclease McrA